ncbi:amidohydrolase family protein [Streptomyces sp. NPDC058297]|uniref:metal-dependent hydrolase family protein n=1 Tax=Streptomyces sp. NPDC058297 TaxID=3346433 RepID=UPI0036EDF14A
MLTLAGATLIDGTGRDPVENTHVVIDGTRIHDRAPSGRTLDLTGLTLLPGLIDAHVHLFGAGLSLDDVAGGKVSTAEVAAGMFRAAEQALQSGFTTLRDCGGADGGLVRAIKSGLVRGPRLLVAGPILAQTGGHGHFGSPFCSGNAWAAPGLGQISLVCDGPDQVTRAARTAFRRGADFLKMCVTGGVLSHSDSLSDTQFTHHEIRAAVREADARGTYVTVHAHNSEGVRAAVLAGARCVEHGSFLDEETRSLMARHRTALVPTLTAARLLAEDAGRIGVHTDIAARAEGMEAAMAESLRRAAAAGVPVGSGSDLLGGAPRRHGLELALKADIIGPMAAITSATSVNARILGLDHLLGTVQPGKTADLIAIDGDPLTDPGLFDDPASVVLVVKDGRIVKDTQHLLTS